MRCRMTILVLVVCSFITGAPCLLGAAPRSVDPRPTAAVQALLNSAARDGYGAIGILAEAQRKAETLKDRAGLLAVAAAWNRRAERDLLGRARVEAWAFFHLALAIREKYAPHSLLVADSLANLGDVALDQDDYGTAKQFYQRALAISEKLAPKSALSSNCLNGLGVIATHDDDLAVARDFLRRSLRIREKLFPDSLEVTGSLVNLGYVLARQGEFVTARALLQRPW